MPQGDMGVSAAAGDTQIASEALAVDDLPDFAPASFFLSKDAELDWLDRNAFMERKDSGKGGASLHPAPPPCSSHRYCLSVKSKPSFIGLPYSDPKPRRPPAIRLFPKRPSIGRKSDALVTDPSSPKVSCIGRVRSRRDRKKKQQPPDQDQDPPAIPINQSRSHRAGFWTNFLSIFGSRPHRRPEESAPAPGALKKSRSSRKRRLGKSKSLRKRNSESAPPTPADPPSLAAVKQFTSGRRSDAWAAELEADAGATKPE